MKGITRTNPHFQINISSRLDVYERIKNVKITDGNYVYKVPILSNKEYWDEELGWRPLFDEYVFEVKGGIIQF